MVMFACDELKHLTVSLVVECHQLNAVQPEQQRVWVC